LWISLARKLESAKIAIHLLTFCGFCCRLPNARVRSIISTGETNCANTALIMRHGGCNICRSRSSLESFVWGHRNGNGNVNGNGNAVGARLKCDLFKCGLGFRPFTTLAAVGRIDVVWPFVCGSVAPAIFN